MTTECKGLWFRISREFYSTQRGFSTRIQARFLKSESCPGCYECNMIKHNISYTPRSKISIDNLHLKQHGQKCRLRLKKKETQKC